MNIIDIIAKKRDNGILNRDEIKFFVDGYTKGAITDYQAAALIMAIYLNGMNDEEILFLTEAMRDSGEKMDLSGICGVLVDKHSTGGVGDKTTLIVAPIVAAAGLKIAKMSGRGLGHTGGTIDKLESISGFSVELTNGQFLTQINDIGIAVVGQSGNLTPADKKIYALRDVTATVSSIPLIASSIMSKKLAAGADNIVLDVKVGSGAFMKTVSDAELLANSMIKIGQGCSKKVSAVLTDMDVPLGQAVGNALEVAEVVRVLNCEDGFEDLKEVCLTLSAKLISSAKSIDFADAYNLATDILTSKKALEKFKEWIVAQGGNIAFIDNLEEFVAAKYKFKIIAEKSGYIKSLDAEKIGVISGFLGAARQKKGDSIDYKAGILLHSKVGNYVNKGDTVAELFSTTINEFFDLKCEFSDAIEFSKTKVNIKSPIIKII